MNEYYRQKQQQEQLIRNRNNNDDEDDFLLSSSSSSFSSNVFKNDEEIRRLELKKQKDMQEKQDFLLLKNQMTSDKNRTENMRRQNELKTQLQLAYKQGDNKTVEKLQKLLAPDEIKATTKHPWA